MQDLGLGRAFAELGHQVQIIRFENKGEKIKVENISELVTLVHYRKKTFFNEIINITSILPVEIDLIICFSDTRLTLRSVVNHCKKHNIRFASYIGTITTQNRSPIIRLILSGLNRINLSIYKKTINFSKTEEVAKQLREKGISDVTIAPVGLDVANLFTGTTNSIRHKIRKSLNIDRDTHILLFVGRLTTTKDPIDALFILKQYIFYYNNTKLFVIGEGKLRTEMEAFIVQNQLTKNIVWVPTVKNTDMWKYYVSADCLVNTSHVEIFGMSIIEAMYYECPVVAYAAPGPQTIITHQKDGYLYTDLIYAHEKVKEAIRKGRLSSAKEKVQKNFLWSNSANIILENINVT